MRLDYLVFDVSDEDDGSSCFDALASVLPERLPALVREVEAVLGWAVRTFGAPASDGGAGEWDFDIQASSEGGEELAVTSDASRGRVSVQKPHDRLTLALTLSGSPAFATAFRQEFPEEE